MRSEREAVLARVTADWSAADLATLTTLFGRLLDDLTSSLPAEPPVAPSPRETS
jgi:hypothetical protein